MKNKQRNNTIKDETSIKTPAHAYPIVSSRKKSWTHFPWYQVGRIPTTGIIISSVREVEHLICPR